MSQQVTTRSALVTASNSAGSLRLEGYAAVFNQVTDLGTFREVIAPGAFDGADISDVRFLLNHTGLPLGRTTARTLQLGIDSTGLHYTVTLPDTSGARELWQAVARGDVSQSSFAFTIAGESWNTSAGLRIVEQIGSVLDVSAVAYPAYTGTSVSAL
jgi:HK97 family phage prohead protease